ncbi:ras GEF [Marasmius fiardii PR-910]|nr:ras GEF [Marasmius fiardii PR-910]
MYLSQQLKIDTSVPSTSIASDGLLHPKDQVTWSKGALTLPNTHRIRTISDASTTSFTSLDIVSPKTASTNASTASLPLPGSSTGLGTGTGSSTSSRSPSPGGYGLVSPLSTDYEEEEQPMPEYVLAMHDYTQPEGSTCLSFRAGQVIHVLNRDPSGWWDGELEGKRGWFPSNFVNSDFNERGGGVDGNDNDNEGEDEEKFNSRLPLPGTRKHTHTYSRSNGSSVSYDFYTRPSPNSDMEASVPPIILPLYHTVGLLQNAARTNRIHHFSPSTATIISCVRAILTSTDTLNKESPILRTFPSLANERKFVLSTLASLVAQTKRASEEDIDEESLELEIDTMLRMAQQLFTLVRRFLAVGVQCGIELPERRGSGDPPRQDQNQVSGEDVDETVIILNDAEKASSAVNSASAHVVDAGKTPTKRPLRERQATPGRPKSTNDIRTQSRQQRDNIPPLPSRFPTPKAKSAQGHAQGHKQELSVSSTASSSSLSSLGTTTKPQRPPFPCGPCTVTQVLDALRYTHDHFLSTIAAFIGHAHTHSRSSHASSTGHMYELVSEIVEMSCKLLAIVEAVLQHPDIPNQKLVPLRAAKGMLYGVTSQLAESVRLLTIPLVEGRCEEEEKQSILRYATLALRSGADLAAAVKLCLNRSQGETHKGRKLLLNVPSLGQSGAPSNVEIKAVQEDHPWRDLERDEDIYGGEEEDVDETIQPPSSGERFAPIAIPISISEARSRSSGSESSDGDFAAKSPSSRPGTGDTDLTLPEESKPPPLPVPLKIPRAPVETDLNSPTSLMRTDEDGATTWEGSARSYHFSPTPDADQELSSPAGLGLLPPELPSPVPDFVADPAGYIFRPDYAHDDIAYNTEGILVGATLEVLVEKLTPHNSIVDAAFAAVFFMTFRLFCTPIELVEVLISRYNLGKPEGLSREHDLIWQQRKGIPVRLRVSNFIKLWLESYWRPDSDNVALPLLDSFTQDGLSTMFPGPAERILDMIRMYELRKDPGVSPKGDRTRDPGMLLNPPPAVGTLALNGEVPRPTMTKALLAALRSKSFSTIYITDFDALELARQLTIMECILYCAIQPEEVLESGQEGAKPAVNVKAVSSLSTAITGWVAECILDEKDMKKRTGLVKFFVKVADKCVGLQNFSTFRSILAALDSSTISRLHQTWNGLPQKSKVQLEVMRRLADHSRNYREYRSRLRNTAPPAVPFLGLYLTDITFCREGNPSYRASPYNADKKLLNFNKYHKLARIVQDMQRFQVSYNLKAIPEVQEYLHFVFQDSRKKGDLQDLYRRSLLVEPKQPADAPPTSQLFAWTRSQSQGSLGPPPVS